MSARRTLVVLAFVALPVAGFLAAGPAVSCAVPEHEYEAERARQDVEMDRMSAELDSLTVRVDSMESIAFEEEER